MKINFTQNIIKGLLSLSAILSMESCDTKSLNSIAAERAGATTASKVVEGATDFAILELQKGTNDVTAIFNKKFPKGSGYIEFGVYKSSECTGTSVIKLVQLIDELKSKISMASIDRSHAFICAWEVSANGKIRNAAANTGLDLSITSATTTSSSSTSSASSSSPSSNIAAITPYSLHVVTTTSASVTLGWLSSASDPASITAVQLFRSDDNGVTFNKIQDLASTALSASVTGLAAQTNYQFKVAAVGLDASLSYSAVVLATTTQLPPGQVTGVVATAGNGSNSISWNTVTGATQYDIYFGLSTGVTTSSTKISNVTSPYSHTVTNGVQNFYIVVASNLGGNGPISSEVNATALFATPPAPINNSTSNITQTAIRMNWASAGSSTNDYIIKCQSGASAPAVSTGGTVTALTYYDYTSLTANTTYTCSVWARNANGTPGLSSTYLVVQGTTLALPTVAITSPAASSYINNASKASFAVSGTCSENGRTVALSGAATGSATCTTGTWSTTLDVSASADGNVTLYADLSSASGSNATQASRVFIKDIVAPPTLTTFTAVTHASTVGANTLTLTLPGTTTDYNNIKTYRSAQSLTTGTTAPSCGSGTLINTTTTFGSSPVFGDLGLNPSSYYAYRVCIYDAAGNLENSKTAVDVRAKGYTWNYWYSADDADGDGNISTGDISGSVSTTWADKSGNARNGTLTNFNFDGATSAWLGDGSVANPYRVKCDGVNDYISQGTSVISRTYGGWLRAEASGTTYFFQSGGNTQFTNQGSVFMNFNFNGSTSVGYVPYEIGKWQHVMLTFDGTNFYIYQNGILFSTTAGTAEGATYAKICSGNSGSLPGNVSWGEFMAGANYLTETDIRNIYENSRSKYFTTPSTPTVERIYPPSGPSAGGTTVKISGYKLSTTTGVSVGGTTASYSVITDGLISVTTPAGTAGFQNIVITNSLGNVTLTGAFNYYDTITNGTVVLDAANISSTGDRGSTSTSVLWRNQISATQGDAKLLNFTFDGTSNGWMGTGIVSDPYRLKFNGTNATAAFYSYNPKTISSWFKTDANVSTGQLIYQSQNGNSWYYLNGGQLGYKYNNSTNAYQQLQPNTWYHSTMTYNGGTVYYYHNGILIGSYSATPESSSSYYLASQNAGGYYFAGSIAEFAVSSGVWSETDARKLYENSRARYQTAQATPTVERITPNQGATAGGTSIRIAGWNLSGATSVTIGGTSATFSALTPGYLTVTTPAGTSGYKDVVVNTPSGNVTVTGGFNFIDPPAGALVWLDAANIDSLGGKGSSKTNLYWNNQGSAGNDGGLVNFGFDGATGWAGTGITSDPYRLKFNLSYSTKVVIANAQPRTYSVWFRADNGVSSSTAQVVLGNISGNNGSAIWIASNALNYRWNQSSSGASQLSTAISNNTWYHAVLTFDGTSTATFYLNNVSIGTYATSLLIDPVSYIYLGQSNGNNSPLTGSIGEFHAFSSSFSGTDVTTIWNMTKAKYGY